MVSLTGVSTRRMFACGAMACAHSTSSVVSSAQLELPEVGLPSGVMILNDGGAGSPKPWSKLARSVLMVGDPNALTRTMVVPLPWCPALYNGAMS